MRAVQSSSNSIRQNQRMLFVNNDSDSESTLVPACPALTCFSSFCVLAKSVQICHCIINKLNITIILIGWKERNARQEQVKYVLEGGETQVHINRINCMRLAHIYGEGSKKGC